MSKVSLKLWEMKSSQIYWIFLCAVKFSFARSIVFGEIVYHIYPCVVLQLKMILQKISGGFTGHF